VPSAPYPRTASFEGHAWYGSSGLWTALPVNGDFVGTKMPLWWSVNFPGGGQEPRPDARIRWTRLGDDARVRVQNPRRRQETERMVVVTT
jgi:hypothetical protein